MSAEVVLDGVGCVGVLLLGVPWAEVCCVRHLLSFGCGVWMAGVGLMPWTQHDGTLPMA